ncbi:hypothetical protein AVEN_117894-1 [Araneus ventricosus]|uniref:Uncharacterized protein n=1 Tax=Araneus ventricosus TaxID=182803 RepID=A0A4Y2VNN7_ARAVE|nr:hypothetical protein AVEN_117894-1 [Araneus ventricosus]
MSDMEKNKKHSSSVSSYYPQPYATTHLSGRGRSDDGTDSGYHQVKNENKRDAYRLKRIYHTLIGSTLAGSRQSDGIRSIASAFTEIATSTHAYEESD